MGKSIPAKQLNHNYIDRCIDQWLDIHFGDTAFNGRVMLGRRKHGGGVYPLSAQPLTQLRPYILMMHASQRIDYYLMANTITGTSRLEDKLFGLQNIVIDVDCHNKNLSTSDIQKLVELFCWRAKRDLWSDHTIPAPNSIVRTGRGVQLWWAIKPCYGGNKGKNCRSFYDKAKSVLMDHIAAMLDEYADELGDMHLDRASSTNDVGFYRVPCTYNTTAKRFGSLEILHPDKLDVVHLAQHLKCNETPFVPSAGRSIALQETDLLVLHKFRSLGSRRVQQLIKLRNLRDNEVGEETRNDLNFSVYNALRMSLDHDNAMEHLRAYNAGFKKPMTEKELTNTICSAQRKDGYKYSNAKLIEFLGISEEEQDAIGLHPYRGKYTPGTRSKPNASRDASRRAIRADRDHKIIAYHEKGISQAETARQLGIGKNTVGRVLKKYKENNVDAPTPEILEVVERHQNGSIYDLLHKGGENSNEIRREQPGEAQPESRPMEREGRRSAPGKVPGKGGAQNQRTAVTRHEDTAPTSQNARGVFVLHRYSPGELGEGEPYPPEKVALTCDADG